MVTKKRNKLRKGNFVATFGVNKNLHLLAISCKRSFRNLDFYCRDTASQLTSPASQKSKGLNKVSLLLQDLGTVPQ